MTELTINNTLIETEIKKTSFGTIIFLKSKYGISQKESISNDGTTIVASTVDDERGNYKLVYTIITSNDDVTVEHYQEVGILPKLFKSPSNDFWTSIVIYNPGKELETSLPIFERTNYIMPKPNRPFTGEFIGITNDSSYFLSVDSYTSTKIDKLLRIEFKDEIIKKKHNLKIDFPKNNKISINENEIHLVAFNETHLLHRQIDNAANIIRQRNIDVDCRLFEILTLNFTNNSKLITYKVGEFSLLEIDENGKVNSKILIDIHQRIYSMWPAEKIDNNTFIIRFTAEINSGWLIIKNNELTECFLHKEKGYSDILSSEKIELGFENLAISSLNKTTEMSYAITFYPITDRTVKNDTVIVLNRQVK